MIPKCTLNQSHFMYFSLTLFTCQTNDVKKYYSIFGLYIIHYVCLWPFLCPDCLFFLIQIKIFLKIFEWCNHSSFYMIIVNACVCACARVLLKRNISEQTSNVFLLKIIILLLFWCECRTTLAHVTKYSVTTCADAIARAGDIFTVHRCFW